MVSPSSDSGCSRKPVRAAFTSASSGQDEPHPPLSFSAISRWSLRLMALIISTIGLSAEVERKSPICSMTTRILVSLVSASVGVVVYTPSQGTPPTNDELLSIADDAMYLSKSAGKDRVSFLNR